MDLARRAPLAGCGTGSVAGTDRRGRWVFRRTRMLRPADRVGRLRRGRARGRLDLRQQRGAPPNGQLSRGGGSPDARGTPSARGQSCAGWSMAHPPQRKHRAIRAGSAGFAGRLAGLGAHGDGPGLAHPRLSARRVAPVRLAIPPAESKAGAPRTRSGAGWAQPHAESPRSGGEGRAQSGNGAETGIGGRVERNVHLVTRLQRSIGATNNTAGGLPRKPARVIWLVDHV